MGGAIWSRVPGGNVAWLWDDLAVKPRCCLAMRSTSLHEKMSRRAFAGGVATCWLRARALRLRCNYACAFVVVCIYRPDSLAEHIDFCSDKWHKCSENVRCPTVISSSVYITSFSLDKQWSIILLLCNNSLHKTCMLFQNSLHVVQEQWQFTVSIIGYTT